MFATGIQKRFHHRDTEAQRFEILFFLGIPWVSVVQRKLRASVVNSSSYFCTKRTRSVSMTALSMRSGSLKVLVMPTLGYLGVM